MSYRLSLPFQKFTNNLKNFMMVFKHDQLDKLDLFETFYAQGSLQLQEEYLA